MKKGVLLNAPVSNIISQMGHGDGLCVGDAGLPISDNVERIDLAITRGLPGMLETAAAISEEMQIERIAVAEELIEQQPAFHLRLLSFISEVSKNQGKSVETTIVSHEEFKRLTGKCRAVVRTGECTPYANVIFYSGVTF
ncbi:D-ribose pyranase [Pseudovibrio axinellae]|uniref:D-ribose pyranase n=1 Tax=Pseudovibrio axinellae TaxID=989403 RepID=A0A161XCV1_9HYPH|nr:D-ribose pyranase [Pseudovibrio axinellae]KZL12588.1 D-ribose pyranase [Pseudovibrio axinellae]SEP65553.1 ribose transport protein RbsD [Pseudovibrio axinellae]